MALGPGGAAARADPGPLSRRSGQPGVRRSDSASALVEGVDVRGEVLGHHAPADLEGRREVAVLLGEIDREYPEPADRLGPGHRLVGVVHRRLDLGDQLGVVRQFGQAGRGQLRVPPLPGLQGLLVESHQAGDVGPAVPHHHALADQRMRAQPVLQHRRGDVLAPGGDDDVLLPAGHPQVAVVVELTQVAGVQPAVGVDHLGGRGLVVPVTGEDVRPGHEDLAVVGYPDRHPGHRPPDRADLVVAGQVGRDHRAGLGEAVALQHGDADAAEEVPEPLAQRGAAGHGVLDPPAGRRAQLAVDEPVVEGVRGPQPQALAAGDGLSPDAQGFAPLDRGPRGRREDAGSSAGSPRPAVPRRCTPSRRPSGRPG